MNPRNSSPIFGQVMSHLDNLGMQGLLQLNTVLGSVADPGIGNRPAYMMHEHGNKFSETPHLMLCERILSERTIKLALYSHGFVLDNVLS